MNLGGMEAIAQQIAGAAILDHAKEQEAALDEKIKKIEEMDEDDFEALREKRKRQMMKQHQRKQEWLANGHGRYMELPDQPAFFEAVKKSKMMAVHFYRPTTQRCQVVDACFEKLAPQYLATRFCKINAEKSPYLCEKLQISVMPTILLVKDTQTVHQLRGFDELGGGDDFHPDMMAWLLTQWGVCTYDGDMPEIPSQGGVNSINMSMAGKGSIRGGSAQTRDDDDWED